MSAVVFSVQFFRFPPNISNDTIKGFYAGTPELSEKLSAMSFGFAEKAPKLFEVKAYSRDIGFKN